MSRHSIDSCTFQLHSWRPFLNLPPGVLEHSSDPANNGHALAKRPCLSDRATSFPAVDFNSIDISKLSLSEEKPARAAAGKGPLGLIAHRKRRRRGSRSVSGRSCSVGAASAAGAHGTCSDFPVALGTDSSGELFGNGGGGGGGDGNWASDVSDTKNLPSSSREREDRESLGYNGQFVNLDAAQGSESGYGSEPGYRGDGEFGYGDEVDEDEEDARLLFWGDLSGDTVSKIETVGEHTFSDQKFHHRGRRKKHDCRMLYSSR